MDLDPVPDDIEGSLELATYEPKELDDVFSSNVLVVREQQEVEAERVPLGAEGDGADGRDPVVTIPALLDRCLAARRKGPADERS